ncbi:MAG: hypothetical protein ABI472_14855 [Ginsengibacter sp.]
MKDRKFHSKKSGDNYPRPGVPADDAWEAMNRMLDANGEQPPSSTGGSRIPGSSYLFIFTSILIAAVAVILLINYGKQGTKKVTAETVLPGNRNTKNATALPVDTVRGLNNRVNTSPGSVTLYDSTSAGQSPGMPIPATDTKMQRQHTSKVTVTPADSNLAGTRTENKKSTAENDILTAKHTRSDIFAKNKKRHHEKDWYPRQLTIHKAGDAESKPISGNQTSMQIKDVQRIDLKNNVVAACEEKNMVTSGDIPSSQSNRPGAIENMDSFLASGIQSSLATFVTSRIQEHLDSSYVQMLQGHLKNVALVKEHALQSTGIRKGTHTKMPGIEYGFQWDVPIPVQGTANYFKGTNDKSKPYNLLLPQLWLSKGLSSKSTLFFAVNFNQQYFINDRKLSQLSFFLAPRDTAINRKSLYKTAGFGGTLLYSYQFYQRWSVALGINYTFNRTALLDLQSINAFTGEKLSDSLYGINRHSVDWQYINKNMLAANLELRYSFKKLSLGAAVYLPLSVMPVYDNKKIHPVNTQLFVRWNIKRD